MKISPGSQLGPYEILAPLGKGGMGEVYRARDAKLKREVAIKILPDELSRDPEPLARFQREAEALAALNHPNIASIYDVQESGETRFLILELVEGETLAERLQRGPMPIEEALQCARLIADALEAAHEKGIIHRDLKPANIKIAPDGKPKVLDFGLAKVVQAQEQANLANSPTIVSGTLSGVILGTAAYMSPEQARGKIVDRRADVWAFGCVLYEMLTGRQAFPNGETLSDTLAGVLAREPDWRALPPGTPLKIRALLESCLRKDERRRLRDMAYARVEIEDAMRAPAQTTHEIPTSQPRRREFIFAVCALVFLITTIAAVALQTLLAPAPPVEQTVRFDVPMPEGATLAGQFLLSPNGRMLAFVASSNSKNHIWVRRLDSATAEPLRETEGTGLTFIWSPDSRHIAFQAEGGPLKTIPVDGGTAQVIASLPAGLAHGAWNADGVILISNLRSSSFQNHPVLQVPSTGGKPEPVTKLLQPAGETSHVFPKFLPDNRRFYFSARGQKPTAYIGTLGSNDRKPLDRLVDAVQFSKSGHVFFVQSGVLTAQRFDFDRLETTGEPIAVSDVRAPQTGISATIGAAAALQFAFSVSDNGSLAFQAGRNSSGVTELAWYDAKGNRVGVAAPPGEYRNPALSPDGEHIAFERGSPADIHVLTLKTGVVQRLTTHPSAEIFPIWAPDSKRVAFASDRDGTTGLYEHNFGSIGENNLLLKERVIGPDNWSLDGKYILYDSQSPRHIWAIPLQSADRKPIQVTQSQSNVEERGGRLSPNSQLVAYASNESGNFQLFVQSFLKPELRRQVSTNGGIVARWSRDSSTLYYMALDATIMSVSIKATGSSLDIGPPVPVFKAPIAVTGTTRDYDVAADGRFLVNVTNPGPGRPTPITVILNWPASLKK